METTQYSMRCFTNAIYSGNDTSLLQLDIYLMIQSGITLTLLDAILYWKFMFSWLSTMTPKSYSESLLSRMPFLSLFVWHTFLFLDIWPWILVALKHMLFTVPSLLKQSRWLCIIDLSSLSFLSASIFVSSLNFIKWLYFLSDCY